MIGSEGKRRNLGRGLSALLGDEESDYARLDQLRASKTVSVAQLRPGRFQPRRIMREDGLEELARSIADRGVLQPLLVRRHPEEEDAYEIIAGERRWRAAQRAQVHEVPVVVKELSDGEALEIALVENIQRQDLSPLEEAEGYRRLMEEFAHSQDDLARSVGKSRSHVANMMRLLSLPDPVKELVDEGALSAGHARALVAADDPEAAARLVVKRGLNVRQTENLVKATRAAQVRRPAAEKDADTLALERDLSALLGMAVGIRFRGSAGTLTLHYRSLEQLDDILHRLSHGARGGEARAPAADGERKDEAGEARDQRAAADDAGAEPDPDADEVEAVGANDGAVAAEGDDRTEASPS
ncbi:MAG: ParB/RepB/Spo0J family partition protein [Rhodospirillales bacterium]|nr:ParB/RepB/Spo0J family partition protein [Rhodospirillales bacterium]